MDKDNMKISMAVIRRLPKYHRYLRDLLEKDIKRISSKELSNIMGLTASQIRQDLNNFGGFGQQGYGYNVEALYEEIEKILGLDKQYNTIIVGAGNLGQAIANYTNFEKAGFLPKCMFDINPKLIGLKIRDIQIMDADHMEEYIRRNDIAIGIICTPKEQAQSVADRLVKCNIQGIWNFAPVDLNVPDHIILENVHLSESLFTLSYLLNHRDEL
ncbi:redox-sensing transcriptional repressor [Geosporobacter subterraneus DSM 17957]|uniref:Redox-sensing transcriptional repressor Rex n=1 Tax=Geosporobacter subterraneus DSM 17957 TaxID=1121919 RepID=A0A1M6CSZ4_9FIRM|nr:redox-sensing transcriptional repressor Rex [Geosporobacter subterraneus]SHI64106.1 redox-sensing transcriptional repressor [Geosporobacter subterraneus DSM 17957]